MAHPHQQQHQSPPAERQNPYPVATSIVPVIFTPISGDDLIAPFNPTSDRIEQLNSRIAAFNDNSKRVRANIVAHMRRECERILWNAHEEARILKAAGKAEKVNEVGSECITQKELDYMIERMMSERGGQDDEMGSPLVLPNFQALTPKEGISFRERYTLQIEATISQGLSDLDGYEKHVEPIKRRYRDALKREMEQDDYMDLD